MTTTAFNRICSELWAIKPEALETILKISARENLDIELLQSRTGKKLENTRQVSVRDTVAIIPVSGPIFRYANMFTEISGATSLQILASDLQAAIDDPKIESIILAIDSPGGQVSGISEFADMIHKYKNKKPIKSYVMNMGASAAYWIAAASEEIILSKTSSVGSIGVVGNYQKTKDDRTIEIVSSQSPKKRPNIDSEEGMQQLQAQIDELAKVFIESVAEYRGVSTEKVSEDFGKGDILIGASAVAAGMADKIGSMEDLIQELNQKNSKGVYKMTIATQQEMSLEAQAQILKDENKELFAFVFEAGKQEGKKQECERIKAIENQILPGHEALIDSVKFDGKTTGEQVAVLIVQAEKQKRSKYLEVLKTSSEKPVAEPPINPVKAEEENLTDEEKIKIDYNASQDLQAEFRSFENYRAYKIAEGQGRIRKLKSAK